MPWESQDAVAEAPSGWESETKPPVQTKPAAGWESENQAGPPMPGVLEAGLAGLRAGAEEVGQTTTALSSVAPQPIQETSPAAAPLDIQSLLQPIGRGLPQVSYRLAKSAPTLSAGIAGGLAGSMVEPGAGTLVGGATGAAIGAAYQTLGPMFAQELKKSPNDPEGAWNRAMEHAAVSGAFSAASWAAFPVRFFQGPVKQLAFQAFGIQPAIGVTEQAAQNVVSGEPITKDLGEAYKESAVGTVVPAVGHMALTKPVVTPAALGPPVKGNAAIEFWKKNFQPELVSDKALQADPQFARYKSASAQERDAIINRAEENYYRWNRIAEPDQLEFMKAYEEGNPIPQHLLAQYPWMHDRADAYRKMLTQAFVDEHQYGSKAGYIEDYFPHLWKQPEKAAATFQNLALPQNLGPKWFQKARYYDLIEQGLQSGLELRSTNPEELVTMRLMSGADMRQRMELLHRLRDMGLAVPTKNAPPNLANQSWRTVDPWQQINAPNKEEWLIAPDVQPLWENAVNAKGLWADQGPLGNAFRGWMQLKNAWVPVKLGLSLFHPMHVIGVNVSNNLARAVNETVGSGQQSLLARAKAIPEATIQSILDPVLAFPIGLPYKGKTAKQAWITPKEDQTPEQKYTNQLFNEGGFSPMLSEQLRIRAKRNMSNAIRNNQYIRTLPIALQRSIETIQKPFFEKWIPNLKASAYLREAESLFRKQPDLLSDPINRAVALRAIGKQVDNRFGEMFYGGLFWNRTYKDAAIGSFLSLGWNLGFVRDYVGGVLEPAARRLAENPTPTRQLIRDVTNKSTNTFLYTMTAMATLGAINYAMTGEYPEGWDYVFPRVGGNNPDGTPRRMTSMFFTREIPMVKKNIDDRGSILGGIMQTAYHKMMISPLLEWINNKDYFGYPLYDENAPGFQQIKQGVANILNEQMNPISITGAKRSLELSGKPHSAFDVLKSAADPDVFMPILGFSPAPAYASRSEIQNRITSLYHRYAPAEKPFEDKEQLEKRREAMDKLRLARQNKDRTKIIEASKELMGLGVKPTTISKIQPGTQDTFMFSKLPKQAQIEVLKSASKEEFKRYYMKSRSDTKKDKDVIGLWRYYYSRQ